MKKSKIRNSVAITLMVVFSGFTAFLGWYSLAGVAMAYGFFFLAPLIAAIVTRREIELSLLYVFLSWVLYVAGLYYWGGRDAIWFSWRDVELQAELVGMCLFCALFPVTPIYLFRRSRREDEKQLIK